MRTIMIIRTITMNNDRGNDDYHDDNDDNDNFIT